MRLNRNRCQYCRFKKCLAVGMSRDCKQSRSVLLWLPAQLIVLHLLSIHSFSYFHTFPSRLFVPSRLSVFSFLLYPHLPTNDVVAPPFFPVCIPCNSLLTVEHILINCVDFGIIWQNFLYVISILKDLFYNIHLKRITSFKHAVGLTYKLNYFMYDVAAVCMLKIL